MYVARIKTSGSHITLFEGSKDACMNLVHAVEAFPQDYLEVEVYENESCEIHYKKVSPFWE